MCLYTILGQIKKLNNKTRVLYRPTKFFMFLRILYKGYNLIVIIYTHFYIRNTFKK